MARFWAYSSVYDNESSLYYLQSRYYDPSLGRFINADAWVSTGQGPTGNNTFSYCGNNPSNYVDSSGLLRQPTVVAMEDGAKSTYSGGIGVTTGSPVLDAGTAAVGAALGAALVEAAKVVQTSIRNIAQAIARTQEDDPEKGPYYVNVLIDGNKNVQYVGRTTNLAARKNAHKANPYRKELKLQEVASNLTYGQARGLEQTLMLYYHTINPSDPKNNQINGISPQNGNKGNYIGAAEGVSGYIWNQISNEVLNWAGM